MTLSGKTALVTGSAKGIGKSIALTLAKHGATVLVHCNTSLIEGENTVQEIKQLGAKAFLIQSNLNTEEDIKKLFKYQIDTILIENTLNPRIDILINNAGICEKSELSSINNDLFNKMMSVNFLAPLLMIKECYSRFNESARVINISSVMAKSPDKRYILYGASKAALNNASLSLVTELGKKSITINTVSPGLIPTNIMQGFDSITVRNYISKNTALQRVGTAIDIADIVLLIATEKSQWMTGQVVEADGGYNK